jgi:hypothetical protein
LCDKYFGMHPFSVNGCVALIRRAHLSSGIFPPNVQHAFNAPSQLTAAQGKDSLSEWSLLRLIRNLLSIVNNNIQHDAQREKQQRLESARRPHCLADKLKSTKRDRYRSLSQYPVEVLLSLEPFRHVDVPSLMAILERLLDWENLTMKAMVAAVLNKSNYDWGCLWKDSPASRTLPLQSLNPASFVTCVKTFEQWLVNIPSWAHPVYHWGKKAGPEPFWRRLQYEQRLGIVGTYTRIDRKDSRADVAARQICKSLFSRVIIRRALVRKIADTNRAQYEEQCMLWEDALGVHCRQAYRATEQEAENRTRFGKLGLIGKLFGRCRISLNARIGTCVISPKSEEWHETVLSAHPWKNKPVVDAAAIMSCENCPVTPAQFPITGLSAVARQLLIANEMDDLHIIIAKITTRVSKMIRRCSWVTGEPVYFDKYGRHQGSRELSAENAIEFNVNAEETWAFGGLHSLTVAVRVVEDVNVNPRGYLRCTSFPVFPAGSTRTQFNPLREKSKFSSYDVSEPVIKASASLGNLFAPIPSPMGMKSRRHGSDRHGSDEYPLLFTEEAKFDVAHSRTGFTSCRRLCQDDYRRGEFATHLTSKGRQLSATAIKRLRTEILFTELPSVDVFREEVWDAVLLERYTGADVFSHVRRIQCLFRAKRARKIVKLLKMKRTAQRSTVCS